MNAPVMAGLNMSGIDKVNSPGLSQAIPFQEQHHWHSHPLLQFYETIIRYQSRKIILVIRGDMADVKMLEIGKIATVKGDQDNDNVTIAD